MTKDEINILSKRQIKDGSEFNDLIAKPPQEKTPFEKGDTFYTVEVMKTWINRYYRQVAKLSKIFNPSDIDALCNKIKDFLFNYLQYQTDSTLQQIRTPSNSWWIARHNPGIDCKSYSVFAGCILKCLGVKFYIRQIRQPAFNKNEFTHVYIVVPFNQTTGSLQDGHSVIDGTITSNNEPNYLEKKDLFMGQKLPHIGLNGVAKKTTKKPTAKRKKTPAPKSNGSRSRFPF